jgi:hypothetical protein
VDAPEAREGRSDVPAARGTSEMFVPKKRTSISRALPGAARQGGDEPASPKL